MYSKSWIVASHLPFFLSFRFGIGGKNDYTGVESHSKEANSLQQILTIFSESGILYYFRSNKSTGPNRSDSMVDSSCFSIFGEGRPSISLSFGYSIGGLVVKCIITLLMDWVGLVSFLEGNIEGSFVDLTISGKLLWFFFPRPQDIFCISIDCQCYIIKATYCTN